MLHAIADLKARGLRVVFYPFILMDIPAAIRTGSRPIPGAGASPAIRRPASPARPTRRRSSSRRSMPLSAAPSPRDFAASDGAVVYSGPAEWSLRRMVLHYAKLCALAGGVDASSRMTAAINGSRSTRTRRAIPLLLQTVFGRAEIGLAGDDDVHVKVSPDGAIWNESFVIDKDDGAVSSRSARRATSGQVRLVGDMDEASMGQAGDRVCDLGRLGRRLGRDAGSGVAVGGGGGGAAGTVVERNLPPPTLPEASR